MTTLVENGSQKFNAVQKYHQNSSELCYVEDSKKYRKIVLGHLGKISYWRLKYCRVQGPNGNLPGKHIGTDN